MRAAGGLQGIDIDQVDRFEGRGRQREALVVQSSILYEIESVSTALKSHSADGTDIPASRGIVLQLTDDFR